MKLLTIPQAAARLKASDRRVRVWVDEKRIKAVKIGARYFIRPADCVRPEPQVSWSSAESKKKIAQRQKLKQRTSKKGGAT